MTEYQQFAAGFLTECTLKGLSIEQMKKVARDMTERVKHAGGVLDTLAGVAKPAILAGLVAPPLLGAAAGHGLARMTDTDPAADIDDIKSQELTSAYQTETDRLRRLSKLQKRSRQPLRAPSLAP